MCGIAGSLNFIDKKIENKLIPNLVNSIKHRGPDNQNFWISKNRNTLMINTRLAIIDLTNKGNQPFDSKDKRYIIVFNGEIYNLKIKKI